MPIDRYSQALAVLQEHACLVAELEARGSDNLPEDDDLRLRMDRTLARMNLYPRECGRIMQITLDSDDPLLSLPVLTPERLNQLLGG